MNAKKKAVSKILDFDLLSLLAFYTRAHNELPC